MKTVKIVFEVNDCKHCPWIRYQPDNYGEAWLCGKTGKFLEYASNKHIEVPCECPFYK